MLTTRYTTISNTVYTVEEGFGCTFVTRQGGTDLDWPAGQRVPVVEVRVRANGGLHVVAREWDVPSLWTSPVREMVML